MNEIAAYGGFPTRYPHWRWGMEYERLSKSHEYGLSKIYELVINNNPAIAYLLEGNSLVDQKLVMAHVYAHVDFFKNNFCFRMTSQGRDPRSGVGRSASGSTRWPTMARSSASGRTVLASKRSSNSSIRLSEPREPHRSVRSLSCPRRYRRAPPRRKSLPRRHRGAAPARRPGVHGVVHQSRRVRRVAEEETRRRSGASAALPTRSLSATSSAFLLEQRATLSAGSVNVSRSCAAEAYYFVAADADEDHERGVGELLALAAHDREHLRRERDRRLRRPLRERAGNLPWATQSLQARYRAISAHRGPLEPKGSSARNGTTARTGSSGAIGTVAPVSGGRRSSKFAPCTTT